MWPAIQVARTSPTRIGPSRALSLESKMPITDYEQVLQITICELRHTCLGLKHKWQAPTHRFRWLAKTLVPHMVRNSMVLVKELHGSGEGTPWFRWRNLSMAWKWTTRRPQTTIRCSRRVSWFVTSALEGNVELPHDPSPLWSIETGSPGVHCWLVYIWREHFFQRAFVCPNTTRDALRYSQPMICLDACHKKNKEHPTQIFVATMLDGRMRGCILCYFVAPVENSEN